VAGEEPERDPEDDRVPAGERREAIVIAVDEDQRGGHLFPLQTGSFPGCGVKPEYGRIREEPHRARETIARLERVAYGVRDADVSKSARRSASFSGMSRSSTPRTEALAACRAMARRHYENFPVLAPGLPRGARDDLAAVYAFCRTTDDLGDELDGDRLAALDAWRAATRAVLAGQPADDPILATVGDVARRRRIEPDLFFRLIEANRRDQIVDRYPDEAALLDYCAHSAVPVGRMVLAVAEARGPETEPLADATCVGLQLANFWQDLARDRAAGRCYLPLDACRRFGVDPEIELDRPAASEPLRRLVADRVDDARRWLERGWPLADRLPARWRALVRSFTRGGWEICDEIERRGHDTLSLRPTLPRSRRLAILARETLRAPRRGVPLPGSRR